MSLLWGYSSQKCDGEYCPNDCDLCYKGDWAYEDVLELKSVGVAKPMSKCVYPKCEECDKYHGHHCTVPMVISKQNYIIINDKIDDLMKRVLDLETLVYDEILRSDKGITIPAETKLNYTWDDYLKEEDQ